MSDEYPNLFEKKCSENKRCQTLKETIDQIRVAQELYQDSLLPKEQERYEQLCEARRMVFDVLSDERSNIATRLAAKYTRNPDYKYHDEDGPGVLDEFEEWQPERDKWWDE